MKKKSNKRTPKYDSERETRVLLEEIGSDVKKIAEQVASNSAKLTKLDEIDGVKSELSTVKMAVMENSKQISNNTKLIKENSTKIDRIENKLDTVTTDHEKRIERLESIPH